MTQFKSFLIPDPAYYDALTGRARQDAPKLAVVPLADAEGLIREAVNDSLERAAKELAQRLVNALTHAERLPDREWKKPLTRQDRENLIELREKTEGLDQRYQKLVEWTADAIRALKETTP